MGEEKKDKFSAVWVSHTSINDFLTCPRAYYLKNVYKDPRNGKKVKIISPPLALGQTVHEVLESLSVLPVEARFATSLIERFHALWPKVSGKNGGFFSSEVEQIYKKRGEDMLLRVQQNPGPLKRLAVKIKMNLPYYWLSEEDNIILCGKLDWLEYIKENESVQIIDFKTGKSDEDANSLQLSIYYLLATHCQIRPVTGLNYWYIERNTDLTKQQIPDEKEAYSKILTIAKQIKLARQLNIFKCPQKTGCQACKPFERVLKGEAEYVGLNAYKENVYILPDKQGKDAQSEIL